MLALRRASTAHSGVLRNRVARDRLRPPFGGCESADRASGETAASAPRHGRRHASVHGSACIANKTPRSRSTASRSPKNSMQRSPALSSVEHYEASTRRPKPTKGSDPRQRTFSRTRTIADVRSRARLRAIWTPPSGWVCRRNHRWQRTELGRRHHRDGRLRAGREGSRRRQRDRGLILREVFRPLDERLDGIVDLEEDVVLTDPLHQA